MFVVIGALQFPILLMWQGSFTLLFQLLLCTMHCLFSVIAKRFSEEGNVFLFFALLLSIYFLVEKSIEFSISRLCHDHTFKIFLYRLSHHTFKVLVHLPFVVEFKFWTNIYPLHCSMTKKWCMCCYNSFPCTTKELLFLSAIELV